MKKKNTPLRVAYWIPNILLYLGFIFLCFYSLTNLEGLIEINRLGIYIFMSIAFLSVALFGTYRIKSWIKNGQL